MVNEQRGSSTGRPHFFKVFLPNLSVERLKIPNDFFKHLEGKTSGVVYLTGPSGNTWRVELVKSKNNLFFEAGWSAFVRDHYLQIGDFFVFRYDGNLHFNVLIFDRSACEKETAFSVKCTQDTTGFVIVNGKKRAREAANEVLNASLCRVSTRRRENSSEDHSNGQKGMHETSLDAGYLVRTQPKKPKSWNAASVFSSNFPCFIKSMTNYNVRWDLNLPSLFSLAHFQRCTTEIILRNTEGRSWIVHILYHSKRHKIAGGWRAFVQGNGINSGDTLVFELVDKFEMNVKVFQNSRQ